MHLLIYYVNGVLLSTLSRRSFCYDFITVTVVLL